MIYFDGAGGQKLGEYQVQMSATRVYVVALNANLYFGGKLIRLQGQVVAMDRLGSVRALNGVATRYYPYGMEYTTTAQDREKFATYYRDSTTGLDYADQRYYASTMGRFLTADPYRASGGAGDPGSWNRYAYTRNDSVNRIDPRGLNDCDAGFLPGPGGSCDPDPDPDPDPGPEGPPPQRTFTISCSLTLEYRPVDVNSRVLSLFNHSYLYLTKTITFSDGIIESSADLVEGLPQRNSPRLRGGWGTLVPKVFYNFQNDDVRDDKDHPVGDQVAARLKGGLDLCRKEAAIENEATSFPSHRYNPISSNPSFGVNSNWLVWRLLSDVGLTVPAPPNAPGYPGSDLFR